ncbi:MAG: triacylglycerol lipase [Rubrivivax sp.]|nr:MAG: triacylglycerol lipase [Rubrivivax sp.]
MRFPQVLKACALAFAMLSGAHAQAADTSGQTRHPIVLVHGMLQFDTLLGLKNFYGIQEALRASGATVLVASVSTINDDAVRGEQLLQQLRQWSAAGGHTRFNLIGHSQGGTTSRYVAGVAPGLVASVTTIGTPHYLDGTGNVMNLVTLGEAHADLFNSLGGLLSWLTGHPEQPIDTQAALTQYANQSKAFNDRFPAGRPTTPCGQGAVSANGVRYYSATGNKIKTNALDPVDLIHAASTTPSDGFMAVCTTHWGQVLRDDYPWNHYDEINQVMGLIGLGAPDPTSLYVQQANRLKLLGL